ncbi:MAG: DNA polymerase IV [Methylotetracoccus sp.]
MDAFYASVELLRYPHLRGLPVVIGGRITTQPLVERNGGRHTLLREYRGRGVVTTATYEARTLGVHSAMGLMKAASLAPDAILLPADFDQYRHYSQRFKSAVATIAPAIEDRGIDEIYIDLTEVAGETVPLGQRIKDAVHNATGLSCSIGIAPNKLLAKVASELDKPDGLTNLSLADLPDRVWPLPVSRLNGIGPKSSARLEALGIRTLGELANVSPGFLMSQFGERHGRWLSDVAHGLDRSPVVTLREPRSLSRETTFERDLHPIEDRPALSRILLDLCERLHSDLTHKGYLGRTIGIKLRFEDFQTLTRELTLDTATAEVELIRQAARACLRRIALDKRIRLLGIRIGSLSPIASDLEKPGSSRDTKPTEAHRNLPLFD